MTPILLFTDNSIKNNRLRDYSKHLDALNVVMDYYTATGLPALTLNEFKQLIGNTNAVIYNKLTNGQPVTVGNITLEPAKAIDMMQKPAGYSNLVAAIASYRQRDPQAYQLNFIDLESGEVVMSQAAIDSALKEAQIYATNEREAALHEFAAAVKAKAEQLFENNADNIDLGYIVNLLFKRKYSSSADKSFEIDYTAIKSFGFSPNLKAGYVPQQ